MYYRNKIDITTPNGVEVEAHSLWKEHNKILTLVDDDQHVEHPLNDDFYIDDDI